MQRYVRRDSLTNIINFRFIQRDLFALSFADNNAHLSRQSSLYFQLFPFLLFFFQIFPSFVAFVTYFPTDIFEAYRDGQDSNLSQCGNLPASDVRKEKSADPAIVIPTQNDLAITLI